MEWIIRRVNESRILRSTSAGTRSHNSTNTHLNLKPKPIYLQTTRNISLANFLTLGELLLLWFAKFGLYLTNWNQELNTCRYSGKVPHLSKTVSHSLLLWISLSLCSLIMFIRELIWNSSQVESITTVSIQ